MKLVDECVRAIDGHRHATVPVQKEDEHLVEQTLQILEEQGFCVWYDDYVIVISW